MPPTSAPLQAVRWFDSSDGVRLPLYELGGRGPTLLVVHATGFHALVYRPMIEALAALTGEPGFRVVAIDLRAHGDSITPPGLTMEWARFGEDVLAVSGVLRQERGTLLGFGHSKGGASLLRAEQNRPGTFDGLYLYEPVVPPTVLPPTMSSNAMVEAARRRRAVFESPAEAIANYASKPPFDRFTPQALRAYVEHGFRSRPDGDIELKCRPEWEAEIYDMSREHGPFERLGEVRCPVTVARGARVHPGPGEWAPEIARRLARGRFEEIPGAGHLGPMERPEAVAASVLEALGRFLPSDPTD
ncbi:MAG: alpha/beta hydrolase [Acidobacteria bacterium]|nr:MAG: alpha/beta hydrolase [Acidobacteriota bacterium]REK00889.1 MAG: alpha/beta hydrolase [Acidobacteriota bacterium]